MFSNVHRQGSRSAAKSVSLGSEFASIALLAIERVVMMIDIHRVEAFGAQVALEASSFVPLGTSGQHLFGLVDWTTAFGANVGHDDWLIGLEELKLSLKLTD